MINYIEHILNKQRMLAKYAQDANYLLLYGAGILGHKYRIWLREKIGRDIDAFIVSKKENENAIDGIPLFTPDEIPFPKDETKIILSLMPQNYPDVEKRLNDIGYFDYLKLNSTDQSGCDILSAQEMLDAVKKHSLFLEDGTIKFSSFRVPNFLQEPDLEIADAVLYEISDFILPLYGDLSFVAEGPYELPDESGVCLKDNQVVIDAGANAGIFSVCAAGRGCTVYAFEPVPDTIKSLEKSKALYPEQIFIEQTALSDRCGEAKFYLDGGNLGNTLCPKQGMDEIIVSTISLDEFVSKRGLSRVDFIKSDIEGSERCLLRGAQETLRRFEPSLAICTYHLPDDPQVLEQLILTANPRYHIVHKWKKLYAWV